MSFAAPTVAHTARLFDALGDEGRVRIIALLTSGELCVCHLVAALEQPQPTISRQLGILKSAGLVESRREGSWVHYRVSEGLEGTTRGLLAGLLASREFGEARKKLERVVKKMGPNACR